jgi:hypothetical protein
MEGAKTQLICELELETQRSQILGFFSSLPLPRAGLTGTSCSSLGGHQGSSQPPTQVALWGPSPSPPWADLL